MQEKQRFFTSCNHFNILCLSNVHLRLNSIPRLVNEVVETTPTVGANVEEIVYKNLKFYMWDIGGQKALRQSWHTYYLNTNV